MVENTEVYNMNVDYEVRTKVMNILIECRKEKGISQKELAKIIDSKETTVASWEQGKSLPSVDMLYRLAKYYEKTMDYMYGDEPKVLSASEIPQVNPAFAARTTRKVSQKILDARNKNA
jgi:putative transcriptional regulator